MVSRWSTQHYSKVCHTQMQWIVGVTRIQVSRNQAITWVGKGLT